MNDSKPAAAHIFTVLIKNVRLFFLQPLGITILNLLVNSYCNALNLLTTAPPSVEVSDSTLLSVILSFQFGSLPVSLSLNIFSKNCLSVMYPFSIFSISAKSTLSIVASLTFSSMRLYLPTIFFNFSFLSFSSFFIDTMYFLSINFFFRSILRSTLCISRY